MDSPLLDRITIRTTLKPGDIGYLAYLHGDLYSREYGYGLEFETYVAEGLVEFVRQYDPSNQRVWVCEEHHKMIGFMLLMNRGESAQLRYFLIRPEYRGIGLGSKLMNLYLTALKEFGYASSYLWTTSDQKEAAALYRKFGFVKTDQKPSMEFGRPVLQERYDLTRV